MSVDENKLVMQRLHMESVDTFKLDDLEEVLSADMAQYWRGVLEGMPFSEHHIRITDMVAEGDRVAIRWSRAESTRVSGKGFHQPGSDPVPLGHHVP